MNDPLPIYDLDEEIVRALREGGRLILQAPTGSGKSTQVPQILLDGEALGSGRCVILQPRRLATRMLAKRVAEERDAQLGAEVGYQIRMSFMNAIFTATSALPAPWTSRNPCARTSRSSSCPPRSTAHNLNAI